MLVILMQISRSDQSLISIEPYIEEYIYIYIKEVEVSQLFYTFQLDLSTIILRVLEEIYVSSSALLTIWVTIEET